MERRERLHPLDRAPRARRGPNASTIRRSLITCALVAGSLMVSSSAVAKDLRPGDVRICNAERCVPIRSQPVLNSLASFYYDSARPPARVHRPRLGAPYFRLAFRNHYVTGIVAGRKLDRFLSYGVNLDRFDKGVWYRVPPRAVSEFRRLTIGLRPFRLTRTSLRGQRSARTAPRRHRGGARRGAAR